MYAWAYGPVYTQVLHSIALYCSANILTLLVFRSGFFHSNIYFNPQLCSLFVHRVKETAAMVEVSKIIFYYKQRFSDYPIFIF